MTYNLIYNNKLLVNDNHVKTTYYLNCGVWEYVGIDMGGTFIGQVKGEYSELLFKQYNKLIRGEKLKRILIHEKNS